MNEPIKPSFDVKRCPGCSKDLDTNWLVCPYCGLRSNASNNLLVRALIWFGVLIGFVLIIAAAAAADQDFAAGLAVLLGLPLSYVFGKAVLFRVAGTPLTWNQLRNTSFRAATATFIMFVVLPIVLGVAFLIFLFVACGGAMGIGGH